MRFTPSLKSIEKSAPRILGAFFCVLLSLSAASCKKKGTPDWNTPGGTLPTEQSEAAPTPTAPQPSAEQKPSVAPAANVAEKTEPTQPTIPAADLPATSQGLRFIAYNVENWLSMDRYVNRTSQKNAPKPDSEKQAVISILARHQPDVIGLCEIGTLDDLAEIQSMLKEKGVDLPHSRFVGGSDPVRHLGLLSKFPISATGSVENSDYQLSGKTFSINRGIMDATIDARGKSYRFIGVHLKSKREVEEGDQEAMRRNEAKLLRKHLDAIFEKDHDARLIVYGDFNDTRNSASLKTAFGRYNSPGYLKPLFLKDSVGTSWTQFWSYQDVYSRIDFVTVSKSIANEVDLNSSHLLDDSNWNEASDHRAVMVNFD
ncbi:hypothetical protein JIN85_17505 [Luteolibacter pohnpeiensis]|uniref:Endonuclease/exonuclease/phosphatase domain-containing protein n=1 Tax=Luteolibacter pohnpeiensis TaxID=454153 RepID=A0A934SA68_9BACT|nr:endonuclease/exonuclease/phosphatase family protein [Luteolibacter pohnpeiensis]MBK1884220.1 hypothetical protein [Luteolibacter pohnpeiensis]